MRLTISPRFTLWGRRATASALLIATFVLVSPPAVAPQNITTHEDAARILAIEKLAIDGGTVSGEVYNRSTHLVRDVQLFVRYTWLWHDEMKPGKDDPGTSSYYTLPKEIPAGGRMSFSFKPSPPLTKISGGRYVTSVAIAGFTEVIPQTK
ncbi:MAG TPA: hypothetical protein VEI95_16945 [Acidobacteriota bacterium]|nr:hypothetical protein [Acidobacteriota bacterium]